MWEAVQFLFPPFIACIILIGILGYLGIHVLEREIIFIDIALAQIAATGTALAFILFRQQAHQESDLKAQLFAIGSTLLAAGFFSFIAKKVTRISHETVIGVSYAIAAAATLFLLALAAGGDVHMEEMFTGSILWVQWSDIILSAVVFAAVGVFHYLFRDIFIMLSHEYDKVLKEEKINVMWWDFLFYASMGIVITQAVKIAGVLVTFSLLIIPATFSAIFTRGLRSRLIIAWILGIIVSIGGLAFSYRFDFSSGPSIVSILGFVLIIAAIITKAKSPKVEL